MGNYRLVSLIAQGGMGQVYAAEREDGQFEQQVLASLEHPNLAKVLDGGITEEGVPYFVMERVAGVPIEVRALLHGMNAWRV